MKTCKTCVLYDADSDWCEGLMVIQDPKERACRFYVGRDDDEDL